jgi:hypothetical protein
MSRKEVYALIQELDLGEEVKKRFGNNYTRIPTKKLMEVIWDYDCTLVDNPYEDEEDEEAETPQNEDLNTQEDVVIETPKSITPTNEVDNPYEAACLAFLGILKDSNLLDDVLAKL